MIKREGVSLFCTKIKGERGIFVKIINKCKIKKNHIEGKKNLINESYNKKSIEYMTTFHHILHFNIGFMFANNQFLIHSNIN